MDEHPIFDGLKIYRRDELKRGSWYCYFIHDGQMIRRSMRTSDRGKAITAAVELYQRFQNGELEPQEVQRVSFEAAARSFLESVERHTDYANKATVVRRFLVPFFHAERKLVAIHAIKQADVDAYLEWRRDYHDDPARLPQKMAYERGGKRIIAKRQRYGPPTANTLNREGIALRQLLDHAAKQGWLRADRVPVVPHLKVTRNRREAFSHPDYARLCQMAEKRVQEAPDPRQRHQRTVLLDFIILLRHTGLRPHEAYNLRWGDVRLDEKVLRVRGGKTGRRDVALLDGEAVERLRAIRRRHEKAREVTAESPVFADMDGNATASVKKSFAKLVEACRFDHEAANGYCPYSLRHLFATDMVARGLKDGILARIMGTSRRMLDGFYDQSTVAMAREWLEQHAAREKVKIPTVDELWPDWPPKDIDPDHRIELVELNEHNSRALTVVDTDRIVVVRE